MIETRVASVIPEAPKCSTVRLHLCGRRFEYKAGQAISIDPSQFEGLRGGPPRHYSLASSPLQAGAIEITVKAADDGELGSHLITKLKPGEKVLIEGPLGRYILPEPMPEGIDGTLHVCAGSGVAPSRGILRHALAAKLPLRHALFFQNRTLEDVLYKREWDAMRDQVKVVLVLSRPSEAWHGRRGYVVAAILREELAGWIDPARALGFVCGPRSFVKRSSELLREIGVASERIITES